MTLSFPSRTHEAAFWPELPGQSNALLIHQLQQQTDGLICVICRTTEQAEQLEVTLGALFESPADHVFTLPDWETLPYDSFSPHEDIISRRIATLSRLRDARGGVLIVPINTALHWLPPRDFTMGNRLSFRVGDRLDPAQYRGRLAEAGYRAVDTVYQHGEYALRGAILDIYPMGSEWPIRLELFDDEIETLRTFDPESQRTREVVQAFELLPAHEYPLTPEARLRFQQNFDTAFPNTPLSAPIRQDTSRGIATPGLEYYLSLFFSEMAQLFDYLPDNTRLILFEGVREAASHFWDEIRHRYEQRRHDVNRPILPPHRVFIPESELFSRLKQFQRAEFVKPQTDRELPESDYLPLPDIAIHSRENDPLRTLRGFIADWTGGITICAESPGRAEVIAEILEPHTLGTTFEIARAESTPLGEVLLDAPPQAFQIACWPLAAGFIWKSRHQAYIAESDLFADRVPQRRRRKRSSESADTSISSLGELKIGSPVVHLEHGIGRYQGLVSLEVDGQAQEFLLLVYANDSKLYVPVSALHLISRYSGTDEALAPIHKLGTDRWSKAKRQALEKIRDTAAELLHIYARRDASKGRACKQPDEHYRAFAAAFPFEETDDQLNAIQAVIADMTRDRPMDRLVCGDVGFGKTEVAMRAAFLAVNSGYQVAVLVPTTLLAQQHYESFRDRFADTAVHIELISRFRTAADIQQISARLKEGKVDILIGTHKLLQKGLEFSELGLLVIDEEHRFGVQQKERIKALRANVDILTLTATPIPRTLNLAMQGVRDLSIIATPPARRLSVRTFVREQDEALVHEAVLREILRGGQVFYLYNEVKSIERRAEELTKLIPDARVAVAHGQMRERQLEQVMSDFYHKRFNVLVCTTIIETGIDIPSANTILIERADRFGLAQLHQLRGRVGRSHHQAYAYLLTPSPKALTEDARKRLEAIAEAQDLGAGFTLATHDLEIRGAGELLGEEQSGHIQSVGFSLYMQLLDEAVKTVRGGGTIDLDAPIEHGAEVNLRLPALIPENYLPDVHLRLVFYKRLANAQDQEALHALQVEMIDRFGLLPEALKTLFQITRVKQLADKAGIARIDLGPGGGRLEFKAKTQVEPLTLVRLIQSEPQHFRLEGAQLKVRKELSRAEDRLAFVEQLISQLLKSGS